jgi:hypothetical protein
MSAQVDTTTQHELSATKGISEEMARARLERVVWAAPRDEEGNVVGPPGLHDLRGTQRTMIVNDLARHGIGVEIRLTSPEALAEVCRGAGKPFDPRNPSITVKGPAAASWMPGDIPWQQWTVTTEWREFPVTFANWLDYARAEVQGLGASYTAMRLEEGVAPGGAVVKEWKRYTVRAIDLFEFRLPGDRRGEQPLAVPGQATREAGELARLHAMIAELQRTVAGLAGTPQQAPATETSTAAQPVAVVVGERVPDQAPPEGAPTFAMEGGAFLHVDESRQVGFDPAEEYDPDEARVPDAELDAALRASRGGGAVKGRSRRS